MTSTTRLRLWRAVPGWPCHVSDDGLVQGPSGKVLKPYDVDGYRHVLIRGRKLRVHHAVLLAFVGPRPPGQECRHMDGNPSNNAVGNLRWGTHAENAADKARHGTERRGEDKPGARLNSIEVAAIRCDPRPSRTVGRQYGISHTAIQRIRRGEKWTAS